MWISNNDCPCAIADEKLGGLLTIVGDRGVRL
jgi:hypothetical protein